MKNNWSVIRQTLRRPMYALIATGLAATFFALIVFVTDYALFRGNLGLLHTVVYTILNIVVAILFGIYVALFVHRRRQTRMMTTMTGALGAGASVVVTGCASCSFTLAAFLGLGSFVALLPYKGLELSVLGIILLVFSIKKLSDPVSCTQPPARRQRAKKRRVKRHK